MLLRVLRVSGCSGPEHFFADREDAAMFGFGFGRFASVIERNGEAVAGEESIRVLRDR